jgi:hypothetical protein
LSFQAALFYALKNNLKINRSEVVYVYGYTYICVCKRNNADANIKIHNMAALTANKIYSSSEILAMCPKSGFKVSFASKNAKAIFESFKSAKANNKGEDLFLIRSIACDMLQESGLFLVDSQEEFEVSDYLERFCF